MCRSRPRTLHDSQPMMTSPASQTHQFNKLTGSRIWLHRVKTPRWKPKIVTLTSDANLSYTDPSRPQRPTTVIVLPGGARPATPDEQIRLEAPHILVVCAIHQADVDASQPRKRHIFLSAPSDQIVADWVRSANHASFLRLGLHDEPTIQPFIHAWGHQLHLDVSEAADRARSLNFKLSDAEFAAAWEPLRKRGDAAVHVRQFVALMMKFAVNDAVKDIVRIATNDQGGMLTAHMLADVMLWPVQRAETELARRGVQMCSPTLLVQLLFDDDNSVLDLAKVRHLHDMTQPLNRYLISSSHNTYLTGDQLQSDSSADMYRIILQKGCRCVEIDAWEGDNGVPVVRHGHTMTSTETFENVVRTIKAHAFSHGYEYPVILSIENHMEKQQQMVAAEMLRTILADMLYAPGSSEHQREPLPSPEQLKGKILLKAKTGMPILRPSYIATHVSTSSQGTVLGEDDEDSDDPNSSSSMDSPRMSHRLTSLMSVRSPKKKSQSPKPKKKTTNPIATQIGELVALPGGSRKALMPMWKKGESGSRKYIAASCVSINEKKIAELYEDDCLESVRQYNAHALTRLYPKGSRVDSSNYMPTLGHFVGCQIVALNWQKQDSGLAVNQARFLANGGCGYVLSSTVQGPAEPGTLSIQVLSGFMLPKSKSLRNDVIDPYVVVKAYDEDFTDEDDYCSFKFTTKVAKSNGFAPSWGETATIEIKNRALAVIYFKLFDSDRTSTDDVIGYYSVPTSLMRPGLRSLPLNSRDGCPLTLPGTKQQSSLLCNIQWL